MILCEVVYDLEASTPSGHPIAHYKKMHREFKNLQELKRAMRKWDGKDKQFREGSVYCLIQPSKMVKIEKTTVNRVVGV